MNNFKIVFSIIILQLFLINTQAQNSGCISGNCQDGNGVYVYGNESQWAGDKYNGDFVNGFREGFGSYIFSSGASYVGSWKGGTYDGVGTFIWAKGDKYIGEWKNGKQDGQGKYIYTSGEVVTGKWENGEYQGDYSNYSKKTGCISGDCTNGTGTYKWENGDKYIGKFENEKLNGQGTYTFASGEYYTGSWVKGKRNGYGKNVYTDGDISEGIWEDDRFVGKSTNYTGCVSGDCENGYGVYVWESGEKFEGNWVSKQRNGYGTNIWKSGSKYVGYWKNDLREGEGTLYYTDGTSKKGFWKADKFIGEKTGCISGDCASGYGTYVWANGDRYEGNWKNKKMDGNGNYFFKKGNEKYIGEFSNGDFHGIGAYYFSDGRIKDGRWEHNKFMGAIVSKTGCISGNCDNGYGTYAWKNGDKYEGGFVNNKMEGQGKYNFSSGVYYDGQWKAAKYDGFGKMVYADGTMKEGIWKEGNYVGKQQTVNKAKLEWIKPGAISSTAQNESYELKICVKSETPISNIKVYVNNEVQINTASRGFNVVSSSCQYEVAKTIKLYPGINNVKIAITNKAGTSETSIRQITLSEVDGSAKPKVALVIGNSAYPSSPLKNPANDAKAIAAKLKKLGFIVFSYTDMTQADMKRKIRDFGNKLAEKNSVGLFYYAGHGIQLNGQNYLIPVDAQIEKEVDVEVEAVNLKRVLGEMEYARSDLNIIILDACRNNPFARSFRSSGNRGLAQTMAPKGSFIAYATAPGKVASDGSGANGLYTQELLKALSKKGLQIEDVFKEVRKNVYKLSEGKQIPWENSSIFGDFYFSK